MKKLKHNFSLVLLLLLFVSIKSDADENFSAHDEKGADVISEVTAKVQGTKSDEIECPCVSSDDKNGNSKLEKAEQVPSNSDDNTQTSKSEDGKEPQQFAESKQTDENGNECNQQSGSQAAKTEELKVEDSDNNSPVAVDEPKQQKTKVDDKNHKTNLNDVNCQVEEVSNDQTKTEKRETYGDSPSYLLGLPRDASYFFDDLEPFINNSDNGRIGRAVPSRDRNLKSRISGKGKEIIEDEGEEDEEDEKNEEDEKQEEDEYDDDEEVDSDCKPTTGCSTTNKCSATTLCPTTTTPCPPPTTKCTTKHQCPPTCKTSPQCTTSKCPRVCGKGADHNLVKDMEKESDMSWDSNKKKHRHGKRRFHNKD